MQNNNNVQQEDEYQVRLFQIHMIKLLHWIIFMHAGLTFDFVTGKPQITSQRTYKEYNDSTIPIVRSYDMMTNAFSSSFLLNV